MLYRFSLPHLWIPFPFRVLGECTFWVVVSSLGPLLSTNNPSRIPRTNTVNRHLCGAGLADASLAHLLRIVGRHTAPHGTTAALHSRTDDKQLEKYYAYQINNK